MNCANCNATMPADAVFCPECGTRPGASSAAPGMRTFSGLGTVAPIRESQGSVLAPGTIFADRYEIVRKLGEGGMGIVYVAKDNNNSQEVALKLIHPELVTGEEAIKRLMTEGLTARQIRHPNIVAVHDVTHWNGQPYFTMEFVKGGTLRSWLVNGIASDKEVRLETAVGLIKAMLAGLGEAHRMGVIHRDLKPENVLLAGDPDAGNFDLKILDFGIARAVNAPRTQGSSSNGFGTPDYMAPEQKTSADAVGPSADLYTLSVMLYEMLMGALPTRLEPVSKNRPDVPPSIDAFLEKGLSTRPRTRYASVDEYRMALDAAAGQRPAPVPGPDPLPHPPPLPPQPPPSPDPFGLRRWAAMSKRTKMWVGGAAVVGVLAYVYDPGTGPGTGTITEMVDSDGDGVVDDRDACPEQAGLAPSGCPPMAPPPEPLPERKPQAAISTASGYWIDNFGNRFNITHDGVNVTGRGVVGGLGPVTIRGTLTPAGAAFSFFQQSGVEAFRATGVLQDAGHINYSGFDPAGRVISGLMHINHED